MRITTPLADNDLLLTMFSGTEGLSIPFSFELTLVSESNSIAFDQIIGKDITVSLGGEESNTRYFNGIVSRFAQDTGAGESDGGHSLARYSATMVPWFWLLTKTTNSRIFQNMSVPDIIEQIFSEMGLNDCRMDLDGTYDPKEYCVQYAETDFNFVSRLLEQEGIFYFFEHGNGEHIMVMGDTPEKHPSCPNQELVQFHPLGTGENVSEAVITDLDKMQEVRIGKYTVNDYNFKIPSTDLLVEFKSQVTLGPGDREKYDYPAEYKTRAEGERLANIRLQVEEAQTTTFRGASHCIDFSNGYKFDLAGHYRPEMNDKSYVLTTVSHRANEPVATSGGGRGGGFSYGNHFRCIPYDVPYRPLRLTPKPIITGVQTAIVVGPSGEEIYPDKYSRIKVQFPWDREGKNDENSSCWIRVSQPWAGAGWGGMFIPHVGHEVIVNFVEGDPDRPIITGRVYHGTNMPADTLPDEKTKSVIRSRQDNDIVIEDKEGDKHIHLKQACGNEIIMHESTPDIVIKQECGNTVHLKASGPDIEITQACGNQIFMHAVGPVIEIKQQCGNSIVMDGATQFIACNTPVGSTKFEMGTCPSGGIGFKQKTDGDWYSENIGCKVTKTFAAVEEYAMSAKATQTIGAHSDYFAGVKHSTMLGAEFKVNASKEFSKNALDRVRKSKGNIKYDSEKAIELIGGSGDEGQLVLDKDGAWIECKGSEIDIDAGSDIKINSKKNINLNAKGGDISLEASGDIILKSKGTHHIKGKLVTPNINDKG